jgi:hypothetical protein
VRCSRRGELGEAWCGGVVAGAALYRLREQGRQPTRQGTVNGGVVLRWRVKRPVIGEGTRRRCRLREGKRGGGQSASGPMERRWPEAHGVVAPTKGGGGLTSRGRRDPRWAGAGSKGCHGLGRLQEIPKKIETGCQGHRAELKE